MTKKEQSEQNEARETLLKWLKPGDTVYTILDHVSRSGMQRRIRVVVMLKDGDEVRMIHPNFSVAKLCGYRLARGYRDALVVSGCGTDMGFEIVYNLGFKLWPEGFNCAGEKCCSSDHSNRKAAPDGTCLDHVKQNEGVCKNPDCKPWHHTESGYALRQEWL